MTFSLKATFDRFASLPARLFERYFRFWPPLNMNTEVEHSFIFEASLQDTRIADVISRLHQAADSKFTECYVDALHHMKSDTGKEHEVVLGYGHYTPPASAERRNPPTLQFSFVAQRTVITQGGAIGSSRVIRTTQSSSLNLPHDICPLLNDSSVHLETAHDTIRFQSGSQCPSDLKSSKVVRRIIFEPDQVNITEVAKLVSAVNLCRPKYVLNKNQCYWQSEMIMDFAVTNWTVKEVLLGDVKGGHYQNLEIGREETRQVVSKMYIEVTSDFNKKEMAARGLKEQLKAVQAKLDEKEDENQALRQLLASHGVDTSTLGQPQN